MQTAVVVYSNLPGPHMEDFQTDRHALLWSSKLQTGISHE